MGTYVLRRVLQMIPVIIGTTFLIYWMVFSLGDPTVGRCGERPCSGRCCRTACHDTADDGRAGAGGAYCLCTLVSRPDPESGRHWFDAGGGLDSRLLFLHDGEHRA